MADYDLIIRNARIVTEDRQTEGDIGVKHGKVAAIETDLRGTAAREIDAGIVVLTGGVAANSRLRERLGEAVAAEGRRLIAPSFKYCTDNAAMIALAGSYRLLRGERDGLEIDAAANLPL